MTVNRKPTGTAVPMPKGLAVGTLSAVAMTLAGCLAVSYLVDRQWLVWDSIGYAVLVILLLSAWTAAALASGMVKRQRLMVCLMAGGCYLLSLLAATALFFGGRYSGVGETGLLVFCGSMLGFLSGNRRKSGRKPAKKYLRNC